MSYEVGGDVLLNSYRVDLALGRTLVPLSRSQDMLQKKDIIRLFLDVRMFWSLPSMGDTHSICVPTGYRSAYNSREGESRKLQRTCSRRASLPSQSGNCSLARGPRNSLAMDRDVWRVDCKVRGAHVWTSLFSGLIIIVFQTLECNMAGSLMDQTSICNVVA